MVAINTTTTLLFNLGIDIFGAIVALLIYFNYRHFFPNTYGNQLIRRVDLVAFWILIVDLVTWSFNGSGGRWSIS